MRVSITVGATQFKNGYLNIDPISEEGGELVGTRYHQDNFDGSIKADVRNLDDVVMDSECVEIIAENVLDYLVFDEARSAIAHWVKKLRHGGRIVIYGTEPYEVCKQLIQRTIDIEQFNHLIHGEFTQPWDVKLSHMSMSDLQNELESHGVKILKKRVNGFSMVVEGERP
jgi:hypothetical protein